MNRKPKNEIIGPTVMRRKLKISGLKSVRVVEPVIKKNPTTMMRKPTAIKIKLILPMVKRGVFSILYNFERVILQLMIR